jgi:hypothetical protein
LAVVEVLMGLSCSAERMISFGEDDLTDHIWLEGA